MYVFLFFFKITKLPWVKLEPWYHKRSQIEAVSTVLLWRRSARIYKHHKRSQIEAVSTVRFVSFDNKLCTNGTLLLRDGHISNLSKDKHVDILRYQITMASLSLNNPFTHWINRIRNTQKENDALYDLTNVSLLQTFL